MNQDDIMRLAREAGFEHITEADYWHPYFARFAALAYAEGAAAERKHIVNLLMAHHEIAQGRHNYYGHVALLIEAYKGEINET
jgi:hypothetical protein